MFVFYGGLFFLLLSRMIFIQATGEADGQALAATAESKYEREQVLTASRGMILDRNGEVIAKDTLSYKLIAVLSPKATTNPEHPRHVNDSEKTAEVLANYLDLPQEKILSILSKEKAYQVEFGKAGRDINHELMSKIKAENLPGIVFERDLKRFYPNGAFASHLIGFAQKQEMEDGSVKTIGKMGLEYTYDKQLTGINGKIRYSSDIWGYLLPNSKEQIEPAQDGFNIELTIDKTIQSFLDDAMTRVEKEYTPEKMMAVIADPKTGKILAMSQRPTFDPETREGLSDNWLNENVEQTIEPGSTMKTFTVASAMEEGKWAPNDWYKSGSYKLLVNTVRDHNQVGWGNITFLEGFQRSSNVAMAYLLERLGDKTFLEYLEKFGFGHKTGIDLPGEATGKIISKYPFDRLVSTFGQGSTVTVMQLIQAETAIATDGTMKRPYVIEQIVNPNTKEIVKDSKPKEVGSPISAETAKKMRELLASTVTAEHGTAKSYALSDYTVAGKTGTAQIPNEYGRYEYGPENYLYSFLGMAPAEDPQLIVYVAVQKPKLPATELGSAPVSKVFKSVVDNSLKYLNIKPEKVVATPSIEMENYKGKEVGAVQSSLLANKMQVVVIGNGKSISAQYPESGSSLLNGNLVLLQTDGDVTIPDFTGWSKKELMAYASLSKLSIEFNGSGFATSQSVSKGTIMKTETPLVVTLRSPEERLSEQPITEKESSEEQVVDTETSD
ncbi:penicillin-binding protein [Paenisporosarcina cavernae]|uniref:Penicillin-binding protein n=1 Tax=Paenisporosarcina cavernae TaxID=2320858 RepID=A0A385YU06_9BACL|nr:penicillin-binding protein [Paenisporosarcina cavernae]AYC29158.1 penicillin-binding protein [Paenisporosarcina cavernae]